MAETWAPDQIDTLKSISRASSSSASASASPWLFHKSPGQQRARGRGRKRSAKRSGKVERSAERAKRKLKQQRQEQQRRRQRREQRYKGHLPTLFSYSIRAANNTSVGCRLPLGQLANGKRQTANGKVNKWRRASHFCHSATGTNPGCSALSLSRTRQVELTVTHLVSHLCCTFKCHWFEDKHFTGNLIALLNESHSEGQSLS